MSSLPVPVSSFLVSINSRTITGTAWSEVVLKQSAFLAGLLEAATAYCQMNSVGCLVSTLTQIGYIVNKAFFFYPSPGLGVDNVQQIRAVLPNGTYVTCNRYQNQDLFFAFRGGGGSTFGVVMENSMLAHPDKPMVAAIFAMPSLNTDELMSILVENADKWATQGFGGYLVMSPLSQIMMFATAQLDYNETIESMKPITDFIGRFDGIPIGIKNFTAQPSFLDTFLYLPAVNEANEGIAMASRLVPRRYFQDDALKAQLASIFTDLALSPNPSTSASIPQTDSLFVNIVGPMQYSQNLPPSDQPGGPGYASVMPAWRDSLWHVIHVSTFNPASAPPSVINTYFQKVHDGIGPLRQLTSDDGGAYQNEADAFEVDPIGSYWGEDNYRRLMEIKSQLEVGGRNILSVHQGIGWNPSDSKYECYPSISM